MLISFLFTENFYARDETLKQHFLPSNNRINRINYASIWSLKFPFVVTIIFPVQPSHAALKRPLYTTFLLESFYISVFPFSLLQVSPQNHRHSNHSLSININVIFQELSKRFLQLILESTQ